MSSTRAYRLDTAAARRHSADGYGHLGQDVAPTLGQTVGFNPVYFAGSQ